jgi:hypothetical protein
MPSWSEPPPPSDIFDSLSVRRHCDYFIENDRNSGLSNPLLPKMPIRPREGWGWGLVTKTRSSSVHQWNVRIDVNSKRCR